MPIATVRALEQLRLCYNTAEHGSPMDRGGLPVRDAETPRVLMAPTLTVT